MHRLIKIGVLLSWLLLAGCSDQRATFEINGGAHSISMIRVTSMPWDKTAEYSVVASRMPDCMRRHNFPERMLNARIEVFSAGNGAWVLRVNKQRMYVLETRTCEGFARLDAEPDGGLTDLKGVFEMKNDQFVFTFASKPQ